MASYNAEKTWDELARTCSGFSRTLIQVLTNGLEGYNEWQSVRAGRTNAQIAADLTLISGKTVTETMIAEMDADFAAHKAEYDYANNQPPTQGDYFYALRKFS